MNEGDITHTVIQNLCNRIGQWRRVIKLKITLILFLPVWPLMLQKWLIFKRKAVVWDPSLKPPSGLEEGSTCLPSAEWDRPTAHCGSQPDLWVRENLYLSFVFCT